MKIFDFITLFAYFAYFAVHLGCISKIKRRFDYGPAPNKHSLMLSRPTALLSAFLVLNLAAAFAAEPLQPKAPTMAEILEQSKPTDWRALDPENTLYLELVGGRVIIELAPQFAPKHVANVKA